MALLSTASIVRVQDYVRSLQLAAVKAHFIDERAILIMEVTVTIRTSVGDIRRRKRLKWSETTVQRTGEDGIVDEAVAFIAQWAYECHLDPGAL